ncbi:MAG TPA: hypothetical protein VFV49_17780, partial [Thermoanaerobaculia bacterium]|nr:hypothetical protein [Thermoanaerobaculia bacterium]
LASVAKPVKVEPDEPTVIAPNAPLTLIEPNPQNDVVVQTVTDDDVIIHRHVAVHRHVVDSQENE